jgi:predicted small secreted protein
MTPFRVAQISALVALVACETVEAFDQNVQTAGQTIESEAVEAL